MFFIRNMLNYIIWYYFFCLKMKNHQIIFSPNEVTQEIKPARNALNGNVPTRQQ